MTVSEYFLLKQFSRNVDHAILTALLNALYNGRRRLTESEIQLMEDEKSTTETKFDDTAEVNSKFKLRTKNKHFKLITENSKFNTFYIISFSDIAKEQLRHSVNVQGCVRSSNL